MNITTSYLKKLIKEEMENINPKSLINEVLKLKDFKGDGDYRKQPVVTGVSAATIPGTGIKEGDLVTVRAIKRGDKPMGRYRLYNKESALAYKTREPYPVVTGIDSINRSEASMQKPGSWYYAVPGREFQMNVQSVSGEGYLLNIDQMLQIGMKLGQDVMDMAKPAAMEPAMEEPAMKMMQESKVTTSYLKKLIKEEINKIK